MFPYGNPSRLGWWEFVKLCDGQFCGSVGEVVASYMCMPPEFVEGSAET